MIMTGTAKAKISPEFGGKEKKRKRSKGMDRLFFWHGATRRQRNKEGKHKPRQTMKAHRTCA